MTAFTQLIAERYKNKLGSEADQYVGYVVDAAVRMTNLIRDLLSYSRLINEESAPAGDVSTNEAIARALDDLQTLTGESGAVIDVDALPSIQGNGKEWAQVFQNLISNAIKHRDVEPPHIRVSAEECDGAYVFSVRDNGIGIDPAYHEKIFGVFKRLHGSDYPGTGIGLAICKKIVEKHGGRIWVESQAGKGSVFRFSVPAHKKAIWMGS
jgi:light-regulated signal transduction histidine kinase (bacteriophytochrome)